MQVDRPIKQKVETKNNIRQKIAGGGGGGGVGNMKLDFCSFQRQEVNLFHQIRVHDGQAPDLNLVINQSWTTYEDKFSYHNPPHPPPKL